MVHEERFLRALLRCPTLSCWLVVGLLLVASPALASSPSRWWPAIFGSSHSDTHGARVADDEARKGMHSAYLASKSKELEGIEGNLVAEMHRRARTSSCWKDAISTLEARCRSELLQEDQRSRLALRFTACQLHHDGKVALDSPRSPRNCNDDGRDIAECVGLLEDNIYPLYIQFRLHVDTLCFHAQEELFQERTETAVTMLDRVSNAALARTKDLTRRSSELLVSLDETRRAQDDILARTQSTSQWLQNQYVLHQDVLSQIALHATDTSQRVSDLGDIFNETRTLQLEALTGVREELSSVLVAQQIAATAAKVLASTLHDLAESSEAQMHRHQNQLESIAHRTQQMAEEAVSQQQTFLHAHSTMVEVLERVFSSQQFIAGSAASIEKVVVYMCGAVGVLLTTSITRVAAARAWCMLALMCGCFVEMQGLHLFLFAPSMIAASTDGGDGISGSRDAFSALFDDSNGTSSAIRATYHLRRLVSVIIVVIIFRCAWRFVSPEESQRRVICAELDRWWAHTQERLTKESEQWHNGSGELWWDQQDGTMCTADVWSPIENQKKKIDKRRK